MVLPQKCNQFTKTNMYLLLPKKKRRKKSNLHLYNIIFHNQNLLEKKENKSKTAVF